MPAEEDHHDIHHGGDSPSDFLSPAACAIAAFTLAVVALLGQNGVSVGVSTVLESSIGTGSDAYYLGWGVATALQAALALVLARRTFTATPGWVSSLGRAAVLVACVAFAAGVLVVIGGVLGDSQGF